MPKKYFNLLLASRSPRRREILTEAGFQFSAQSSNSSESFDENLTVEENLKRVSREKVEVIARPLSSKKTKGLLILGADTVVIIGRRILGQPKSPGEAAKMLRLLSGKLHIVKTGFCLFCPDQGRWVTRVVSTKVGFRKLSNSDIQWYVNSGEPFDKAGGYGIQGLAKHFITSVQGEFLNVVGLPLTELRKELRRNGWHVAVGNSKPSKRSRKSHRK